ncbi:focadhesin-like [Dendronephthya gigantea]|uniref:focadhesin-like n=1 Tax=Dendronephthya gigantea TaxID=151771 RepID=UPI00106B480E|nr:focadhesin-like [Dendronephthya gigantea]
MVLRGLCDLFSLVPSSVVDSKQYENFKENVLLFLWRYSEHENEDISDASYKALSKFETKDFLIRHLPKQTRQTVTQRLLLTPKIKKMMEECLQNEKEMDIETLPIPAYFYVELLQRKVIFPGCYQGLEEFLKSIVAQEISNLPRGVEHSKMKAVQASENKSMSSIPEQLKKQYDKCKQPSLKSSIAVSLLYSYEIHAEKRSGKPIRSQVVNNIKLYRQLINQLVQDVPVKSSDWRSNIEISHAWILFMNRVFDSYVQGRRAELELQNERGQIDEKAYNEGLKNASSWTRDALTDLLKAASKGSQIMHCNSLLALAALANAVFVRTSDDVTTNQELLANYKREGCISAEEWIACVADTLIVTLDRKLKTVGVPLSWGKQVSSTTLLAQAAAAIALAQITPCLIDAEFERFKQVLEVLQTRMSEQAKADSQTVVQTHCCIALGSIVQKLYDTNISDSLGQEGDILVATTFDALRKEALSSESNNTEGAIYGLGLAMSSLSYDTDVLVNDRAKSSYSKMVECFNNERVKRDQDCKKLQELGIALACCTVSRFATDCLEVESVLKTFDMIKEVTETFPESVDLASAFGMLLCNLKGCGIIDNSQVVREWTAHWKAIASDKSLSLNSRIAAIFGLSFLFNQTQTSNSAGITPEDGVKILKQLLNIQGDYNLSGTVFKNLGKLYYASKNRLCNQPNVPDTLDYLGEDSVLNWLIQLMISLGKEVTKESEEVLNVILQVLTYGPKETLPPVDWNGIITPLIKMYTGKSTTLHFLELALCSTPSPATARFLPSWLTQSVYLSFSTDCQVRLFSCLPQLLNILSAKKLTNILDIAAKYFSNDEVDTRIAEAILDGLCSVMHMPEPPKSLCIKETIEKIYNYFPVDLKMLVPKLVACVQCLESHKIESLTAPTEESFAKSIMFRRRIILENPSMLKKLFKPCIDFTLSSMDVKYDAMMSLVSTISCVELRSDSRLSTEWILQFLAELSSTKSETKTVLLLLTTFTLAISGYDNGIFQIILALQQDNLFQNHQAWFALIKNLFPYSFAFLLAQPQWKGRLEETIQKLLATCKDLDIKESSLLLDFLLEMRNFDVYEKHSVWSQVVCCM